MPKRVFSSKIRTGAGSIEPIDAANGNRRPASDFGKRMQTAPTCFVIMPYRKRPVDDVELDFDVIFDEFIASAARAAGFEVLHSDRELASGVVMRRVFSAIHTR